MKKYILFSLLALGIAWFGTAFVITLKKVYFSPEETGWDKSGVTALLEGFEPDTEIKYTIFSPLGEKIDGREYADEKGHIRLPAYENAGLQVSHLTYEIEEQRKDEDSFRITLKLNPAAQKLSVLGEGLEEFSDMTLEAPSGSYSSKTDWVGRINFSEHLNLDDKSLLNRKSFE